MRKEVEHNHSYKLNLYRYGLHMMRTTFKNKDIKIGVRNALFLTKMFTQSSDVLLYRKDDKTEDYDLYINALMIKHNKMNNVEWLRMFINEKKQLFEGHSVQYFDCTNVSNDSNITVLPYTTERNKYVLVIRNCNIYDVNRNEDFIKMLNDVMDTVLQKLDDYLKYKKEGNQDKLTGIDNRNAFENDIKEIYRKNEKFTYVLFDLFRLKYINDNYGYPMGDAYIIKAVEILKRYFPKWHTIKDTAGISIKYPTGSCLYRTGGDEFILISKYESLENIINKLKIVEREVENIELNIRERQYLGINYGIAVKGNNEELSTISSIADARMRIHKDSLYERYKDEGVQKRKQLI